MIYEKEYMDKVYDRFNNGGKLWFIERTDTNQYPEFDLEMRTSHSPEPPQRWSDTIDILTVPMAYLTKEDGEKDNLTFSEGGCHCCGHGSTLIPTIITEHEFVALTNDT